MLISAAFLLLTSGAAAQSIEIRTDLRYDQDWVIQDTFLDQNSPEANYGGDQFLSAGAGKVTLIRFNNIHERVPAGRIVRAELVMRVSGGEVTGLRRAGVLRSSWSLGSGNRAAALPFSLTAQTETLPGATFLTRHGGEGDLRWSAGGAGGNEDILEVESARLVRDGALIRITNLEQAVTLMRDNPAENFGFRLEFEGSAEIHSSRSAGFRPELIVETDDSFGVATESPGAILYGLQADEFPSQNNAYPAPGTPVSWQVRVGNWGDSAISDLAVEFRRDGRLIETATLVAPIEPGGEVTVRTSLPWADADESRRWSRVSAHLIGDNVRRSQDTVAVAYIGAIPVAFRSDADGAEAWRQAERFALWINEVVFPSVRFRATPAGVQERIRVASVNQGDGVYLQGSPGSDVANLESLLEALQVVDASQGQAFLEGDLPQQLSGVILTSRPGGIHGPGSLRGDFRNDLAWDNFLPIPDPAVVDPMVARNPLPNRNVVPRTSATLLNAGLGVLGAERERLRHRIPRQINIQVTNTRREPVAGAPVRAFWHDGTELRPLQTSSDRTTSPGGSVAVRFDEVPGGGVSPFGRFPGRNDAWAIILEVRAPGGLETLWLPYWQLIDEYGRGNRDLAIIALRGPFGDAPADRTEDRALDRVLTDSKGNFPAELQGLVDGNYTNPLSLDEEGEYWIEIDLGRDRPLAEVRLLFGEGAAFPQFRILAYNTAQTAAQARLWVEEGNGLLTQELRAGRHSDGVMMHTYRAPSTSARFLRIVVPAGSAKGILHGIQVFPPRGAEEEP